MKLIRYQNVDEFLAACGPWLTAREAENLLLLGVANNARKHPERFAGPPYLAQVVGDGGVIEAAAVRTPPRQVVLTGAGGPAVGVLLEDLFAEYPDLSGVIAPVETAREFCRQWTPRTGMRSEVAYEHRYYRLTKVVPPAPKPGSLRLFAEDEFELMVEWFSAFQREMGPKGMSAQNAVEFCRYMLEDRSIFYWHDGRPAAMAGWTGETAHGARVVAVYTPPELRNRGYASICVAALSQRLLDAGRAFCGLAADRNNPVPHRVYQKIGYEAVCDFDGFNFFPPD